MTGGVGVVQVKEPGELGDGSEGWQVVVPVLLLLLSLLQRRQQQQQQQQLVKVSCGPAQIERCDTPSTLFSTHARDTYADYRILDKIAHK